MTLIIYVALSSDVMRRKPASILFVVLVVIVMVVVRIYNIGNTQLWMRQYRFYSNLQQCNMVTERQFQSAVEIHSCAV